MGKGDRSHTDDYDDDDDDYTNSNISNDLHSWIASPRRSIEFLISCAAFPYPLKSGICFYTYRFDVTYGLPVSIDTIAKWLNACQRYLSIYSYNFIIEFIENERKRQKNKKLQRIMRPNTLAVATKHRKNMETRKFIR